MPVLRLNFGDSVLKELAIGVDPATIGRSPQDDIFIDNPAVSFHHARVFSQAGVYYVQDLDSLNGTFLNGNRITQAPLTYGDVITVGKHTVRFARDLPGVKAQARRAAAGRGRRDALKLTGTMVLDTKMRRELQERFAKGQTAASSARAARMGKLTVLKGKTTEKEFLLTSRTAMIGKSDRVRHQAEGLVRAENCRHDHQAGRSLPVVSIGQEGFRQRHSPDGQGRPQRGRLSSRGQGAVSVQHGGMVAGAAGSLLVLCPGVGSECRMLTSVLHLPVWLFRAASGVQEKAGKAP